MNASNLAGQSGSSVSSAAGLQVERVISRDHSGSKPAGERNSTAVQIAATIRQITGAPNFFHARGTFGRDLLLAPLEGQFQKGEKADESF